MKSIETISLIGLGAIGSANLAKISESFPMDKIRVIASGERAERYRDKGVTVNGKTYKFPVYKPEEKISPADLLIFAVKNNHLPQAIKEVGNHVGKNTIILSLLNGVSSEKEIGKIYGIDKVLYSFVTRTDATRIGGSTEYGSLGLVPFGEAVNIKGMYSEKVLLVEEFFKKTGIKYDIPENMVRNLWLKFMLNVGANQVTAVLRCPYGAIKSSKRVRELAAEAMQEAVAVSRAENIPLEQSDIDNCLEILGKLTPTGKTSMLQDVEARRKTEVEAFGGTVCSLAKKHGIKVPVNETLVKFIMALEETFDIS
ncbi:MAG: ketopantoate reductase family protein [Synergistaceae bacterium]|nr:ketopantoate reductase family protein [Synergistaceae bacterium]